MNQLRPLTAPALILPVLLTTNSNVLSDQNYYDTDNRYQEKSLPNGFNLNVKVLTHIPVL